MKIQLHLLAWEAGKMTIIQHIPPSSFVQDTYTYRQWCSITICHKCGATGKYEDAHTAAPCRLCGDARPTEKVGRWISTNTWFDTFWGETKGYWEIKGIIPKPGKKQGGGTTKG